MARPKIKLFQFIQKFNRAIGIDSPESDKICCALNWKNLIFLFCEAQFSGALLAFLWFEANSMLEYGTSFFAFSGAIFGVIIHSILVRKVNNWSKFIENCEGFMEKRKRSAIEYNELNRKIELFCKLLCFFMLITCQLMTFSILLSTIVNYCIFNMGTESFYLVFPIVLPFDWKTPFGYPVAWLLEYVSGCATFSMAIPHISPYIGSCWLFIIFADDITKDLTSFSSDDKFANENHSEKRKRFSDIIQIYSDAKQCIHDFNGYYEYLLFIIFIWNILMDCCLLLTIQSQLLDDNLKPIEIVITSLFAFWIFGLTFLMCEMGERVFTQFELFGKELGRCKWYELSIEMQRMFVIFLSDTQHSINIKGYGGTRSTREIFKNITNKGFSYFMALRKIKT